VNPLTAHERAILVELLTRDKAVKRVLAALHPKQRAFAYDLARRIAAHCGRRSGKSHGIAGRFLITAIRNPGETSVFIAISAATANEIIGQAFRVLGRAIGWQPRQTSRNGQIYWEFPNGHRLWVAGCKNKSEAEKFRGFRYCGAAVDEADSMRSHLQYLCEDVLEPALMDLDGWLALTGTPGATPAGYFHDVTTGSNELQKWVTYHWTCLDNPFLPNAAAWLRRRQVELGMNDTSPRYLREYLGQWVKDTDALVYAYDPTINQVNGEIDLTLGEWRYIIGIDLGVDDATAFVVGAYLLGHPDLHIVESQSWTDLGPSSSYGRLMEWRHRYPGCRVVADTGGQGRAFTKEWADRFNLYVESAKTGPQLSVQGQVAFFNGLLRSGSIKVHQPACRSLTYEWSQLPWDDDRTHHQTGYPDHEADAARYCILAMRPNYKAEHELPAVGSPEWQNQEATRLKAEAFARARKLSKSRKLPRVA
jgi:hypothetical protein